MQFEKRWIEEQIKDYEYLVDSLKKGIIAFKYLLENQLDQSGWIPCSERMPNICDIRKISIDDAADYLVCRRNGSRHVAKYVKIYGDAHWNIHCVELKNVIAWQPLPEPYRGGWYI